MTQTPTELLTRLRENLIQHFGTEELRSLCFDLGVDYEDLPGEGRAAKARELIAYMDRRGRIAELAQKGSELRPNVSWQDAPEVIRKALSPDELTSLRQDIVGYLSDDELHELSNGMGLDDTRPELAAPRKSDRVRKLVTYLERRNRIPELIKTLSRQRPDVSWGDLPATIGKVASASRSGQPDPSQSADNHRDALQRALAMARRTLTILEEQAAGYTALTIPVHLKIELEEKRREVAELDARLTQPPQPTPRPLPVGPASQHDVFLSYGRKDTDMMRRLLQDLRSQGLQVWVDETGLERGTPAWETAIGNAIENARCMVVILSPDAKESIWVGRELSYAETHNVRIFPVLARGDVRSAIPIRLTSAQFVDVRQDYSGSVQRLVATMRKHLGM